MRVLALLLVAVTITAAYASTFLKNEEYMTALERKQAINEAIKETMDEVIYDPMAIFKSRKISKNQYPQQRGKKHTSSQLLKFFKKPSEDAKRMGKANRMYRNIVSKAERKMFEVKRAKVAKSQGAEARAESLAEMLIHRPGSMLTSQEVVRAWQVARNTYYAEEQAPKCDFSSPFRTISGICNNRAKPLRGSSGIALRRLLPPFYEDKISSLRGTMQQQKLLADDPFGKPSPSVRFVSERVINSSNNDEVPFSHLIMQFGQFLDHDLGLSPEEPEERGHECTGCTFTNVCQPIRVREEDTIFGKGTRNNRECLPFRRSLSVFGKNPPKKVLPQEQVNDVTSFIDASMIYGSREDIAKLLRSPKGGGLLLEGKTFPMNKPTLPPDIKKKMACPPDTDCFLCGDVRCNEQISLTIIHTLWLREHNRCARKMTIINPHWNDEMLYQTCRKIVGALIQKITYEDYLPKIMGKSFHTYIGDYTGYDKTIDPSIPNSFSTAAYRYGHSLIRPSFDRLDKDNNGIPIGPLPLVDAFFSPRQFKASLGTDPIARGWLHVNARRMDEFMTATLTTKLFQTPATSGFDLGSLNLQRGRDHGLPNYGKFKQFCLQKYSITSEIENMLTQIHFINLYGSTDAAEVWIAGMAEKRIGCGLLGPIFACIFGLTFKGVREGDRFFWENPDVLTIPQKNSIRRDSISRVICENSDNIDFIQPDAFLTNQTRVACSGLEGVNFNLFKEEKPPTNPTKCSIGIKTTTRRRRGSFPSRRRRLTSINIKTNSKGKRSDHTLKIHRGTFIHCIQVECPTKHRPMTLSFPTYSQNKNTRLTPHKTLRRHRIGRTRAFSLGIDLFGKREGLFTQNNCKSKKIGFTFAITYSASETYYAEDMLEEDKSESYGEDMLEEDMSESYGEDMSESYGEDMSESYGEDMLEEDMSESYGEDMLEDNELEDMLEEDKQEVSQDMESEYSNARLESSMEVSNDQHGSKEEKKQQKIVKTADLFGELREALEKLN